MDVGRTEINAAATQLKQLIAARSDKGNLTKAGAKKAGGDAAEMLGAVIRQAAGADGVDRVSVKDARKAVDAFASSAKLKLVEVGGPKKHITNAVQLNKLPAALQVFVRIADATNGVAPASGASPAGPKVTPNAAFEQWTSLIDAENFELKFPDAWKVSDGEPHSDKMKVPSEIPSGSDLERYFEEGACIMPAGLKEEDDDYETRWQTGFGYLVLYRAAEGNDEGVAAGTWALCDHTEGESDFRMYLFNPAGKALTIANVADDYSFQQEKAQSPLQRY